MHSAHASLVILSMPCDAPRYFHTGAIVFIFITRDLKEYAFDILPLPFSVKSFAFDDARILRNHLPRILILHYVKTLLLIPLVVFCSFHLLLFLLFIPFVPSLLLLPIFTALQ